MPSLPAVSYANGQKDDTHHWDWTEKMRREVKRAVEDYILGSFDKFYSLWQRVTLVPIGKSTPLRGTDSVSCGLSKYRFEVWCQVETEVVMRQTAQEKLELLYEGRWQSLESILECIPLVQSWVSKDERKSRQDKTHLWQRQWDWWVANGKKFTFLELPAEIREKIYGFVWPATFEPFVKNSKKCSNARRNQAIAARQGNADILRLNKLCHRESSHLLFRDTTFVVEDRETLKNVVEHPVLKERVTNLYVGLHPRSYFYLFGFYLNERDDPSEDFIPRVRNLLIELPHLKHLNIFIGLPDRYNKTYNLGSQLTTADSFCQRQCVDWIFKASFKWLKGLPVQYTGYISRGQQKYLDGKCDEARTEYLAWQKHHNPSGSLAEWKVDMRQLQRWRKLKPLGHIKGTLEEWSEWMAEEDGGLRLTREDLERGGLVSEDESKDLEKPVEKVKEERHWPPICECKVRCGIRM